MGQNILRLRGLPFNCSEEDVRNFFKDLEGVEEPVAVHIGLKNGKSTGESWVEFKSSEDANKALKLRQHEYLGSRYVEIFVASEADLLAQTSGVEGAAPSLLGHVVRLRGLPFNSTAQDVLQFFEGVDTVGGESGIVFTCTPDGRPTGEAYVALQSAEALEAALARHKEKIGARYIEIFESSKGDMYQAVQQHGYFTTMGGRRRHHWHQQHGGAGNGGGAGQGQYPPDAGGGGGRGRGSQMDEMTNAFAGFGLSQRDMQVPGPPRWGAYGAPADQHYQQYVGGPPRQMQQAVPGVMPPPGGGPMRWRPGQMQPGGMQHFNPAPGPPPGKGRPGVANGARQQGGAGGGMMGHMPHHEYGGGQPTMMFGPFMMQHPLMLQQQQHASLWGTPAMMQQHHQGGAWYSSMQMGRGGGLQMSPMGTAYAFSPTGFFPMRAATGMSPQMSVSSHHHQHHHQQQYGSRQQSHTASGAGSGGYAAASSTSAASPTTSSSRQHPHAQPAQPPAADVRSSSTAAANAAEAPAGGSSAADTEPEGSPAAAPEPAAAGTVAEAPAVATPEQ